MLRKTIILSAMAAGALAAEPQATTIEILVPMVTEAYGSIINVDSDSITTAFVRCPKGVVLGDQQCSIGENGGSVTLGPFTWQWTNTASAEHATYNEKMWATLDPADSVVTITRSVYRGRSGETMTSSRVVTMIPAMVPVTITAGADKLVRGLSTSGGPTAVAPNAALRSSGSGARPAITHKVVLAGAAAVALNIAL